MLIAFRIGVGKLGMEILCASNGEAMCPPKKGVPRRKRKLVLAIEGTGSTNFESNEKLGTERALTLLRMNCSQF